MTARSLVNIRAFSSVQSEDEFLLLPGTTLTVKSVLNAGNGLTMVQVEEDLTAAPLLDFIHPEISAPSAETCNPSGGQRVVEHVASGTHPSRTRATATAPSTSHRPTPLVTAKGIGAPQTVVAATPVVAFQNVCVRSQNFPKHSWSIINDNDVRIASETAGSSFKIVPGLTGLRGSVSFEDAKRPGWYLRHCNYFLRCHKNDGSALFLKDATFMPRGALTGAAEYKSFESVNFPSQFICHRSSKLRIGISHDSDLHRNDASFLVVETRPVVASAATLPVATAVPVLPSIQKVSVPILAPGRYRIKTAGHKAGGQPAGWGLSAWNGHGAKRNNASSWIAVHKGDHWPCDWIVVPGKTPGTYRLKTAGHQAGNQPGGWGLSAWNGHGAKRNDDSSRVAVHEGDYWPCDWTITPGQAAGTWRVKTCQHDAGNQPAGWGLSTWQLHGGKRNGSSSWVYVHKGDHWPCDWIFEKV